MPKESNETEIRERSKQENAANENKMSRVYDFLFKGKAPVWTALSTVMMMVFSGLLWHLSDIANETSIATQRAILSDGGPAMQKVNNPDGKTLKGFNIVYVWQNSGTTPAKDGSTQFNVSIGQTHPFKGLDFSKLPQGQIIQFVLGPKAVFQLQPVFISVEQMDNIALGRDHLFFWGWATYRDGLANTPERLSEFCTDIASVTWGKADHTDPAGDLTTSSPPCETHNCYDEACDDYTARTR